MRKRITAWASMCGIVCLGLIPLQSHARLIIQGDLEGVSEETDSYLAGEVDEFVGLVEEEWDVIRQFAAADPERYEGVRTEDNDFLFTFNEDILADYDGNPYFTVNTVFGGAIEIDPKEDYAIKVGSAAIAIEESELDSFVFDVQLRDYVEQEDLRIEQIGESLTIDPEGDTSAHTDQKIVIKNGRVHTEDTDGGSLNPVNLLPKKTGEKILSRYKEAEIVDLSLEDAVVGEGAEYHATVEKQGKILGLVPVSVDVEIGVDAEDETITTEYAPWWDIFVF